MSTYEPLDHPDDRVWYWFDPETGAELWPEGGDCNGLCVYGRDILMPGDAGLDVMNSVAYPHPSCAAHGGHDAMPIPENSLAACERSVRLLADAYEAGWAT